MHNPLRSTPNSTWAYLGVIKIQPHVCKVSIFFTQRHITVQGFLSEGWRLATLHACRKQFLRVQPNCWNYEQLSPLGDFGVQACLYCVNLLRNVPCKPIFLHKPLTALPHYNVQQWVSKGGQNRRRRHVARGILPPTGGVSKSGTGPGCCRDSQGPAAAALVLSIEVEAACRAMLLTAGPGNTRPKLCLATNRDITLVMTQSTVVRPQGAP